MTPLVVTDMEADINKCDDTEKDAFHALYLELEKGIQTMKSGEVYTMEEAWEEIDKI